jgi:hypothetical protein
MFWLKQIILSKRLATNSSSSVLFSILYILGLIDWSCYSYIQHRNRKDRPHVHSTTILLKYFIVCVWHTLDSNGSLHHYLSIYLPNDRKVMRPCGSSESHLPCRRTFDKRLKTVSIYIKERITTMGCLFVSEGLVKPHVLAIDSTLVKVKGLI